MKKNIKNLSRRKFLGQASCAGLGYLSLASTITSLRAMNALAISNSSVANSNDYKALVVFFKFGGNDSFNTLIPRDISNYDLYANARGNVAIQSSSLLPINLTIPDSNGRLYGLHPNLGNLQTLFNNQQAAFVCNVGTKIKKDTSKADYDSGLHLPVGLFSHNDQIEMWQSGITDKRSAVGWGGRIADLLSDLNSNQDISMSISLDGINSFQNGNHTAEYSITTDGSISFTGLGGSTDYDRARTMGLNSFMEHQYNDIFKQTYADVLKSSKDADATFKDALLQADNFTQFTSSPLGKELEMVSKVISVKDQLGAARQIFFVGLGGWDGHKDLISEHADLLDYVNADLQAFYQSMEQIGMQDQVLFLQLSEFGRTISSNQSGTDHAWGGNIYLIGGQNLINGGLLHGSYPNFDFGSSNPINAEPRGRMIPDISTDEYFGEIARWYGVPASELNYVFPNIGEFYDYINEKHPVGILKPY